MAPVKPRRLLPDVGLWAVCATLLALVMYRFGMRQFGAFDDNIIVDTGWRIFNGQRPYVDFYIPLSPEFYLGAAWAYKLWGVAWSSLVLISVAFAVFTFALQSLALGVFMPRRFAIATALGCQTLAMVVTSYWWYNSNASITACVLYSAAMALAVAPRSKIAAAIFCLAVAMLSLMKVNIAAVCILAAAAPLLAVRELRLKLIALVAAGGLAAVGVLFANHVNPLDMFHAYLKMAGSRGLPRFGNLLQSKPNEAFVSLPLLGGFLATFVAAGARIIRTPRDRRPREFLALGAIATSGVVVGIWSIFMSTEESLVSGMPLMLLSVTSLLVWAAQSGLLAFNPPRALVHAIWLASAAAMVGFCLFDQLPFDTLIGSSGLASANLVMLMTWTFLAVASVAVLFAGLTRSRPGPAAPPAPARRNGRSGFQAAAAVAVLAGASIAFYLGATTLFIEAWHRLPLRFPFVFVPFQLVAVLWAVVALTCVGLVLAAASAIAAIAVGGARLRVGINGPELFYSEDRLVNADVPFFRGLATSRRLASTANEMRDVVSEYRSKSNRPNDVFFGIRLEFGYAAFGIASPRGMPVWWDPAAAYPPGDLPGIVERFRQRQFGLCVFYGHTPDFVYLPGGILSELTKNYRRVPFSNITVFIRNSSMP